MKLDYRVYEKAAELIFDGKEIFACHAIMRQLGLINSAYDREFSFYFKPDPGQSQHAASWYGTYTDMENQNARILALLFMAEIAKEEL